MVLLERQNNALMALLLAQQIGLQSATWLVMVGVFLLWLQVQR